MCEECNMYYGILEHNTLYHLLNTIPSSGHRHCYSYFLPPIFCLLFSAYSLLFTILAFLTKNMKSLAG